MTVFLPELVSDQAVRLTFSNFGEVVAVFKGRHKFNKNIRNGRRHVKIFPEGGDPGILPRKITFHGRIQRDVLFAEKVVLCYRCKTRHMLGENCPVATPAQEDSSMSLTEQSGNTVRGTAPVQQEFSVEIQPSAESQQASSPSNEGGEEEDTSEEGGSGSDTDSDSVSDSDDGNGSELGSSAGPAAPLVVSSDLPPRENLPVVQGTQADLEQSSRRPETVSPLKGNNSEVESKSNASEQTKERSVKPKKTLRSLKNFPHEAIYRSWYANKREGEDIFTETIVDLGLKGDGTDLKQLVALLYMAADIIRDLHRGDDTFRYNLEKRYVEYFRNTALDRRPKVEVFDNYLYTWAMKVWPRALYIIANRCRR